MSIMRKLTVLWTGILLLCMQTVMAQKQVTGKVTDSKDSSPISGVSVSVKGSNVGVSTGSDGVFSILIPKGLNTLLNSAVGYEDAEVTPSTDVADVKLTRGI